MLLGGCPTTAYVIPKPDLQALAQQPPENRGAQVRAIQSLATDPGPPAAPAVQADTGVVVVGAPVHVHAGGGPRHTGPGAPVTHAQLKAGEGKAWLVLAVFAAVGLAVTEGMRYDGWVALHPMHPVHLYGPRGEYTWVPLAHLDPQTAAWASRAYVRETEGPFQHLGRAPLNRKGATYSVLLGRGELISNRDNDVEAGPFAHIQLGVFPSRMVGVLLDFGLGWRENSIHGTVYESRNALELQALPLILGPLHGGGFAQAGIGSRYEDGAWDERGFLYGVGGLAQLELTTRLAITGRVGMMTVFGDRSLDATLGISIY